MDERERFIAAFRAYTGGDRAFASEVYDTLIDPDPTGEREAILMRGLAFARDSGIAE